MKQIEFAQLASELDAVEQLIGGLADDDFAGRIGLEAKREELRLRLQALGAEQPRTASVAIYFGGAPVVGSLGIDATFGSEIIATYQDLVTNVWAIGGGMLATRGPIPQRQGASLHITNLVHGSFGFLLEELDPQGEPLFPSPLKNATDAVSKLLESFGSTDETLFEHTLAEVSPRVLSSVRTFFRSLHNDDAVCRVVSDAAEVSFDAPAVERAYNRAEFSDVAEDETTVEGELLGVIPMGRRFEFRVQGGALLRGNIGPAFGESYLVRIHNEQLAGRRWRAVVRRRETRRGGNTTESFTLLDLQNI
jgi:hypothetical protein